MIIGMGGVSGGAGEGAIVIGLRFKNQGLRYLVTGFVVCGEWGLGEIEGLD